MSKHENNSKPIKHVYMLIMILFTSILLYGQLPIQPAREISFTTTEGSYINLDLSPDGKTLVFDLLGNLYTMPASGGKARQITKGLPLDMVPMWSKDGQTISFISDRTGDYRLATCDVNGQNCKTWQEVPEACEKTLKWLANFSYDIGWPDGIERKKFEEARNIIYETERLKIFIDSDNLCRYDKASGKKDVIFYKGPFYYGMQKFKATPDGRFIAFYFTDSLERTSLQLVETISGKKRILVPFVYGVSSIFTPDEPLPHYAFSNDSKSVYISYGGKIHNINILTEKDILIPFEATVTESLGPLVKKKFEVSDKPFVSKYTRSASISPDGRKVIFTALNKVYIKELRTGVIKPLVEQPYNQLNPDFSLDGKWIAYATWDDKAGGAIWRIPSKGGVPEKLTDSVGQYTSPTWSRDGKNLFFMRGPALLHDRDDPGEGCLEMYDFSGKTIKKLDENASLRSVLSFSRDGKMLYYSPKRDFVEEGADLRCRLKCLDLATGTTSVAALGGDDMFERRSKITMQRAISPDGKYIVFSNSEDLLLAERTNAGEPIVIFDKRDSCKLVRFRNGVDPRWNKDGKTLEWSYGNKYYQVDINKVVAAAKSARIKSKKQSGLIDVEVKPDREIALEVTAKPLNGNGTIILKNARIITMQNSEVVENGVLVIKDGRIVEIGKASEFKNNYSSAKEIDVSGKTIIPGFIDLHLHMRLQEDIFPQQYWQYLTSLAYGVTTACEPSNTYSSFGYAELLKTGAMIGPRMYSVGRSTTPSFMMPVNNYDDAFSIATKRKLMGGEILKQYTQPNRIQKQWLLKACDSLGLNMTNETSKCPKEQLGMIKDGSTGIEHVAIWGDVYSDVIRLIAASGTYIVPTLQVFYSRSGGVNNADNFDHLWANPDDKKLKRYLPGAIYDELMNAKPKGAFELSYVASVCGKIFREGGRIGLGSHGNDVGTGPHNELWALQMGGLTNMEALQVATLEGARALGLDKHLGSLEVGKVADMIILDKDPLDDIHNSRTIKYVMKDGILYDGETLDMLWPYNTKCPEWRGPGQP